MPESQYLDSFDNRVTADIAARYSTVTNTSGFTLSITSAAGRNGTNGLRITRSSSAGANSAVLVQSMNAAATYKMAFARRWSTLPPAGQSRTIAAFRDAGTVQSSLLLHSDGTLEVVRGSSTALTGGRSILTVSPNVMYHFEWSLTVNNATGASELRVNETDVFFTVTNQNTRSTGNNIINEFSIRNVPSDTLDASFTDDIDDLIVHDGSFVGDARVGYLKETGAGTYSQWTANGAATLYECVDDTAQDGDTTYTSSNTVGQRETFAFEDVPTTAVIKYLQHVWVGKKTDAGTRTFARRTKSGVTESLSGTSIAPSTTYATHVQMENLDPATGAVWTAAGFNAAEFGEEITA